MFVYFYLKQHERTFEFTTYTTFKQFVWHRLTAQLSRKKGLLRNYLNKSRVAGSESEEGVFFVCTAKVFYSSVWPCILKSVWTEVDIVNFLPLGKTRGTDIHSRFHSLRAEKHSWFSVVRYLRNLYEYKAVVQDQNIQVRTEQCVMHRFETSA